MSDDEREDRDRLPKLREFDGNAEDYLDADEGYQRYARRHYKGGIDEWIYGGKCPIKDDLEEEEIEEICHQIVASLQVQSCDWKRRWRRLAATDDQG